MKQVAFIIIIFMATACAPKADLSRCIPATDAEIESISAGLVKASDGALRLSDAWAVKSNDYANVWIIAAYIYGAGAEMEKGVGPGVWAHGGEQDDPRLILAVGGFAHQFSNWGTGETTDAEIRLTSDGVKEAMQCAEANHK